MDYNNKPPEVVFEGEEFPPSAQSFKSSTPKMVQWVIKYSGGVVKDEQQANYVLIGFVTVAVTVSLFLIFGGGNTQPKSQNISNEMLIQMTQPQVSQ